MDAATRRLLIAVQFCYGVFPILGKVAMTAFEPRAVLIWRLFVGSTVLFLLALWRHGRAAVPAPADLLRLAGLSLLGVVINQTLFLEGLHRSTAVNAGLLMCVIPVATTFLAVLLRHESLTRRRGLGVLLSVVGVVWLFVGRGADLGAQTRTGDLLLVMNAISYSFYLVLARPLLLRLPNLVVVAWVFIFGALIAPWIAFSVPWVVEADPIQWLALAGILVFPTILAYLGNVIVLARTHASVTATYVMLQPVIAAALGILILGERPQAALGVTAACVLGGLYLVSVPVGGRARS